MTITLANEIRPRAPGELSMISRVVSRVKTWLGLGGSISQLPSGWINPFFLGLETTLNGGPPWVTEQTALGLPAFGRGVELISSTLAAVDLRAYRYDASLQIDVRIDPAPEILRDPDPISTPWNWRFAVAEDLILYGNSFAFFGDFNAQGWPRYFQPIDATAVQIAQDQATGNVYWRIGNDTYSYGSLWHCSAGTRSGYILGRGVLDQYASALSGVLATDTHARRYFSAGGMPAGIIQATDPDFSQQQADMVKQRYRETVGSGSREPLILPPTLSFTPVVSDAEKQQLVNARQWDSELCSMILGIPSHYLNLPGTSMTYQNIEQVDIQFIRDTVDRWAKPIEHAMSKWALPYGTSARFDWTSRMRHDNKSRAEVIKLEIEAGILTPEEARRALNRPPAPEPPQPVIMPTPEQEQQQAEPVLEET